MRTRMHPLSQAIYDVREDGLVEVTLGERRGLFTPKGVRVEGTSTTSTSTCATGWPGRSCPPAAPATPRTSRRPRRTRSDRTVRGHPRHDRGPQPRAGRPGRGLHRPPRPRLPRGPRRLPVDEPAAGRGADGARRALHLPGVPRPRGREGLEEGVADGLPGRGHPRARAVRQVRHRRHLGARRPPARRLDQGPPQRVPAPRPHAEGAGRPRRQLPVPLPRHHVGPRRLAQAHALQVGLPAGRRRVAAASPCRSTPGAASSSSTSTPTPRRSPTSSATCPRTSSAGRWRSASSRSMSARCCAATGRSRRRPSWSRGTSSPPTPSCCPASATRSASTTPGATSPGRSRPTGCPART